MTADKTKSALDVDKLQAPMFATHASCQNLTYEWRMEQLSILEKMLAEKREEIRGAICRDLGRDPTEALLMETNIVSLEIAYVKKNLKQWMKTRYVPSPAVIAPGYSEIEVKPLNPPGVLIFGPFNFPMNLVFKPLVGVLAAGNPAVLKPSELCPNVCTLVKELVEQYFEPGVVQVVLGGVAESKALLEKPWAKVMFTGSERTGALIAQACAKTLTPTLLELGGQCPTVVEESVKASDIQNVADRIIFGKTMNAGQLCVAPNMIFVHEKHADALGSALVKAVENQFGKDPKKGELARIINEANVSRLIEGIKEAEDAPGTKILCGGSSFCDKESRYVCPTVIKNPPSASKLMTEEIFGPVLPIVTFRSTNEAIARIQDLGGVPLHMHVFVPSTEIFKKYTDRCRAGGASHNDCLVHMANFDLPFGGLGTSGYGQYFGKYTFDAFSQKFPVVHRWIGSAWDFGNLRCHPFAGKKGEILEKYLLDAPGIPVLHLREVTICIAIAGLLYAIPSLSNVVRHSIADMLEVCVLKLRQ